MYIFVIFLGLGVVVAKKVGVHTVVCFFFVHTEGVYRVGVHDVGKGTSVIFFV